MTPQTATRLTIYENDAALERTPVAAPLPSARRLRLVENANVAHHALMRRESLHRRLLGAADLLAAAASLLFVLVATGSGDPGLAVLAGTPLVIVLFKVAGLYDRDSMRLVH